MTETQYFGEAIDNIVGSMRSISCGANDRDIFLWELIHNAAWALYNIRLASLFDKTVLDAGPEFFIHIVLDKTNNTLSIIDSGTGMTKDELGRLFDRISSKDQQVVYLGCLESFRKAVASCAVPCVDVNKEVGLGFWSVLLVADKVKITTKHNGNDEQYVWECHAPQAGGARGFFTITRDTSGEHLQRGTKVTLFLNKDGENIEEDRLKDFVQRCSEFIRYPMSVFVGNSVVWCTKKQFLNMEEKREQLIKFEPLRKRFEDVLGGRVEKVVVSDRVFDLPCWMSTDFIFEINPQDPTIEELLKKTIKNKNNNDVRDKINYYYASWHGKFFLQDHLYGMVNSSSRTIYMGHVICQRKRFRQNGHLKEESRRLDDAALAYILLHQSHISASMHTKNYVTEYSSC